MTTPIVVGAGPPTRAGGIDLYLELVAAIAARTHAEFVWIASRPRAVARRLDAEAEALDTPGRIEWRPSGDAPKGPGVVLAVTARTDEAARLAVAEAAAGTPVVGLTSDPVVDEVLRDVGASMAPYPDVAALAQLVLAAAARERT